MYKIFIDEIINNKKMYSLTLLYMIGLIISASLLYEPFLSEIFDDFYFLIILLIFSNSTPMLISYKSEKLMLMNAKLPISLFGLYFTRIIKIMLIPTIGFMILLITYIFDENAFSILTISGFFVFTLIIFSVIIYQDMKIATEKYPVIKKYSLRVC